MLAAAAKRRARSAARPTPSSAPRHQACRRAARCRPDRAADRRCGRACSDTRHGALAPQSGVLLQARRRPDPRHRPLLHDRSWSTCSGRSTRVTAHASTAAADPHRDQRAAQRAGDRGRGADHGQRRVVLRRRRQCRAHRVLGRLEDKRLPFEIYGTEGSMLVPDPNFFGGDADGHRARSEVGRPRHLGPSVPGPNRTLRSGAEVADYRIIGLLDMAAGDSTRTARTAPTATSRCTCSRCMDAFERSSVEGRHVMIETPLRASGAAAARRRRGGLPGMRAAAGSSVRPRAGA